MKGVKWVYGFRSVNQQFTWSIQIFRAVNEDGQNPGSHIDRGQQIKNALGGGSHRSEMHAVNEFPLVFQNFARTTVERSVGEKTDTIDC